MGRAPVPPYAPGPALRWPLEIDSYLMTDAQGIILEADGESCSLLHCPREFLIGKPLGLFVVEEDRSAFYQLLVTAGRAGAPRVIEVRLGRANGKQRDVILMAEAVDGAAERPSGFYWRLRDVSATRQAESALRAERQLLDSVIAAAQAIILTLDAKGYVLRSNPYLHAVSGLANDELLGRRWDDLLLQPEDRPAAERMVREALSSGLARSGVLPLRVRHGGRREVVWSARSLPEGLAGNVVLLGHDVTDLQEAQRQSLRAERLATIGQVAAGLAHESRNALQRIQACLAMLGLRLKGQPEVLDLVARAQRGQDDLQHLFEDVLSFARAPRLSHAACDLAAVWREAWSDLDARHNGAVAELVEEIGDTDLVCQADAFALKRVFRNLFENARAATDGPVRVVIRGRAVRIPLSRVGPMCPAVEVRLQDNGPGFPPDQRHRLFEPFFTTRTQGTGLGLALCRRLVEAHGGRIEAGKAGPGAEIVILLPRRTP